jgi:adenosylhomocysteine nucleosidase
VITGIVVALPEELATLTSKRIEKGRVFKLSDHLLIVCSGAGIENANCGAELLFQAGVERLISWGCAAALKANYRPGDLILANGCVDADRDEIGLTNDKWISHIKEKLAELLPVSIHVGKLAESGRIISTSEEKLKVANATGAIALDMESTAIAKVAQVRDLPFLTIRTIADTRDMNLPKAISYSLDEQGVVVITKLLRYVLLHPSELPGLVRLGVHFHAAKKTLKQIAMHMEAITGFGHENT